MNSMIGLEPGRPEDHIATNTGEREGRGAIEKD